MSRGYSWLNMMGASGKRPLTDNFAIPAKKTVCTILEATKTVLFATTKIDVSEHARFASYIRMSREKLLSKHGKVFRQTTLFMVLIFLVEFFISGLLKKHMHSRSKICCPEHHIMDIYLISSAVHTGSYMTPQNPYIRINHAQQLQAYENGLKKVR
jgi:hypothetical protein